MADATDPFDAPKQVIVWEVVDCINGFGHPQIITESMFLKEGFSDKTQCPTSSRTPEASGTHSRRHLQIALPPLHSILPERLIFANNSASDRSGKDPG